MQPQLLNQLEWAKGNHNSMYGNIISNWKWVDKQLIWDIVIPTNTTAQIKLSDVSFSEMTINNTNKIKINTGASGFNYALASGKYQLVFK